MRITSIFSALTVVVLAMSSCSDKMFDDRYRNPSKIGVVSCDKLFTGLLWTTTNKYYGYGYCTYGRLFTWESYFARWSRITGHTHSSGDDDDYFISDGYATHRWNNFYDMLAQYRLMESTYSSEASEDQQRDKIFLWLSEVWVYDQLSQMLDVFGPVPFTQAAMLPVTSDFESSLAPYDSDVLLYSSMLDRLGQLASDIEGYADKLTNVEKAMLTGHDLLNQGDLDKWVKYANSLRFRLAMHVSDPQGGKNSLANKAQEVLKVVYALTKEKFISSQNLTVDGGKVVFDEGDNILGTVDTEVADQGLNFAKYYKGGFSGRGGNQTASQEMVDAMDGDPRLSIIYCPTESGEYIGRSFEETVSQQKERDNKELWKDRCYATLDSVTFIANGLMKNPVFTVAEMKFLLAEAAARGYIEASAEELFKEGIKASLQEWAYRNYSSENVLSFTAMRPEYHKRLTADEVASFASVGNVNDISSRYSDKLLEGILTQKWLHLGIMQAHEAWREIRRTGLPAFEYPRDKKAKDCAEVTQRIKYPNVEKSNNTANYNVAVGTLIPADDNAQVLFWAKKVETTADRD